MDKQYIPEFQEQARSSELEESTLTLKRKNSLQLKKWQIVLASLTACNLQITMNFIFSIYLTICIA